MTRRLNIYSLFQINFNMGTFTGIKIHTENILFKFHVVSLFLRVRPSHQKSDAKSVFFYA